MSLFIVVILFFVLVISFEIPTPERVLFVVAHPDDTEDTSGGLIKLWTDGGTEVSYLVLTNGDKGWHKSFNMTYDKLAAIREQEQLNAANVLGVHPQNVVFGHYEDGGLDTYDKNVVRKLIVKEIRLRKPEIVLTFSPNIDFSQYVNGKVHHDHQRSGYLTLGAVYPQARDWMCFEDLKLDSWKTPEVWLFEWDNPEIIVDIESTLETKIEAYQEHKSQYDNAEELSEYVKQIAINIGKFSGGKIKYGEGFKKVEFSV